MTQALFAAASGASVYEKRLDILANNLSNMNTVGFKQDRLIFEVPAQGGGQKGGSNLGNYPISAPPSPTATRTDFSPGQLRHTQNALDLALDGEGFFIIQTPDGRCYTRKGNFTLNQEGVLVTKDGYPVLGKSGEIKITGHDVRIDEGGDIWVDGTAVDTISVVSIPNTHTLRKLGGSLFSPPGSGVDENKAEDVKVKQGFIETSNVNAIKAMIEMIDVLRGYESYQKVIKFLDDATRKSINEVGKLR